MFTISDGGLWYDGRRLGAASGLYADSKELATLGEKHGVKHLAMPQRIDYVFVAGTRVVGCESKRPGDLVTSTHCKRLARQVRELKRQVDVAAVVLRGGLPKDAPDVLTNLVALQAIGVILIPTGPTDMDVLSALVEAVTILADESRSALVAVAATDKRKPRSLLEAVKGIGPGREALLHTKFDSPLDVLNATDAELKEAGLTKGVIAKIREAGKWK